MHPSLTPHSRSPHSHTHPFTRAPSSPHNMFCRSNLSFYDIGSSVGTAVFCAMLCAPGFFSRAVGIECEPSLHKAATTLLNRWRRDFSMVYPLSSKMKVEFKLGDGIGSGTGSSGTGRGGSGGAGGAGGAWDWGDADVLFFNVVAQLTGKAGKQKLSSAASLVEQLAIKSARLREGACTWAVERNVDSLCSSNVPLSLFHLVAPLILLCPALTTYSSLSRPHHLLFFVPPSPLILLCPALTTHSSLSRPVAHRTSALAIPQSSSRACSRSPRTTSSSLTFSR
jgi:hypothetical protein